MERLSADSGAFRGGAARPLPGAERTLAEQLAAWLRLRIDEHALKPGTRLPSIRRFASERGVSRSTVVEAYDRLIAAGEVESRRGSGFYVRAQRNGHVPAKSTRAARAAPQPIDVVWLLRSMLRQSPASDHPGAGLLPPAWLDDELVAGAVRAVGRSAGCALLSYGVPEGYLPLRQQLSQRLAQAEIGVPAEQIVTTQGVTHGIDLVARHFVAPGDTVFVEDPAWYVMFGRFAAFGAHVVGVPRALDGPDTTVLANLLTRHQPKLFVVGAVLHNPTGTSISAACAHRLLKLADEYGFTIVEDDVYGDLHPGRVPRLASLDQLSRVIYLGGFSKTLAANLRVGFVASSPELAPQLANHRADHAGTHRARGGAHPRRGPVSAPSRPAAGQARRCARPHRAGAGADGGEAVHRAVGRHLPVGRLRSRHQRNRRGGERSGHPVRAGQPVLADATAKHVDACVRSHVPESGRDEVPRAVDRGLERADDLQGGDRPAAGGGDQPFLFRGCNRRVALTEGKQSEPVRFGGLCLDLRAHEARAAPNDHRAVGADDRRLFGPRIAGDGIASPRMRQLVAVHVGMVEHLAGEDRLP